MNKVDKGRFIGRVVNVCSPLFLSLSISLSTLFIRLASRATPVFIGL